MPPKRTPKPPRTLQVMFTSTSVIELQWVDVANNETAYELERQVEGEASFSLLVSLPARTNRYRDADLEAEQTASYRVRARNQYGVSTYSNVISASTLAGEVPIPTPEPEPEPEPPPPGPDPEPEPEPEPEPPPPTDPPPPPPPTPLPPSLPQAFALLVVASGIQASWTHDGTAALFSLERAPGTSGGSFAAVQTINGSLRTVIDTTATAGQVYRYRLRALAADGTSSAYTPTLAVTMATLAIPVSVTQAGWVRFAQAFTQGQVLSTQGVVFPDIPTQNRVLQTWGDGSVKHMRITAKFAGPADTILTFGSVAGGLLVPTAPTLTMEATPEGLPTRTATFTDTGYSDRWDTGALCVETKQVVSFAGATGALAQCRALFYLTSYNDGTHEVAFAIQNSMNHTDAAALVASLVCKINGAIVLNKPAVVTTGPGTLSSGGGYGLTTTQPHGLQNNDYARYSYQGLQWHSKVWETANYGPTGAMSVNGTAIDGVAWQKVTFLIPWGAKGISRHRVNNHARARWTRDLSLFYAARLTHKPHAAIPNTREWSQTMLISTPNVGSKQYSAGDFELFNYGIYAPQISLGGQRAELALKPEWILQWELYQTPELYDWMLAHGDLAAATSHHLTNADGTQFQLTDDGGFHYLFSLSGTARAVGPVYSPELNGANGMAHQGSYFYPVYLFTGDRLMAEELASHSMFGVINNDAYLGSRGGANGYLYGMGNGWRSGAWAARSVAEAVAILPTAQFSRERTEFARIVLNNQNREAYYLGLEPDSTLHHPVMMHERLLTGMTTDVVNPPNRSVLSDASHVYQMFMEAYIVMAADHCERLGVPIFAGYKARYIQFWVSFARAMANPANAYYAFAYYGMPWMVDGGPVVTFNTYAELEAFNISKGGFPQPPAGVWYYYAQFFRFILKVAVKEGIVGAQALLTQLETRIDDGRDYTYYFQATGSWGYGLSNGGYALGADEGYTAP